VKSFLRKSKCDKSTLRKVEQIVRRGEREIRRQFVAAKRRELLTERGIYVN